MDDLRDGIGTLLEPGLADDPVDHARQVALLVALLYQAFERVGMDCVLIGGCAIELYAPGIFKSGDIDLIIDPGGKRDGMRDRIGQVFERLEFKPRGRHWVRGDLFVEVPAHSVDDPTDYVKVGSFVLRAIAKEALLVYRLVGFKHWKHTAYGQQVVDMLAAFGDDLRMDLLHARMKGEAVIDAFEALRDLANSSQLITEETLQSVLARLR